LSPVGDVASAVENALAAYSGTTAAPHEYFDHTQADALFDLCAGVGVHGASSVARVRSRYALLSRAMWHRLKIIASLGESFKNHFSGLGNIISKKTKQEPSAAEQLAYRALLDKRAQLAMVVGTAAFTLNTLEPWLALHDFVAVKIQLAVALALIGITALSYTDLGGRHKLALFTFGFLVAIAGFHERAFNPSNSSEYSAGFPIFFAFYCVFIPVTVLRSALTGLAALAIVTVPDRWATGRTKVLLKALVSNSAAFSLLLYWRQMANRAWEGEFRAREREYELISMISHREIRTPLSTLCLISEELEAGNICDEEDRHDHYRALAEESIGFGGSFCPC
jgi:hypothetical protein